MNSISLLTSLKDALERGAHGDSQSPGRCQVRSGPGPLASNEEDLPLCDCAIHTYSHDLARPRRTLQETQASSRQVSKKIKKIKQIQKTERKSLWTLAVTSQCRTRGERPSNARECPTWATSSYLSPATWQKKARASRTIQVPVHTVPWSTVHIDTADGPRN